MSVYKCILPFVISIDLYIKNVYMKYELIKYNYLIYIINIWQINSIIFDI